VKCEMRIIAFIENDSEIEIEIWPKGRPLPFSLLKKILTDVPLCGLSSKINFLTEAVLASPELRMMVFLRAGNPSVHASIKARVTINRLW